MDFFGIVAESGRTMVAANGRTFGTQVVLLGLLTVIGATSSVGPFSPSPPPIQDTTLPQHMRPTVESHSRPQDTTHWLHGVYTTLPPSTSRTRTPATTPTSTSTNPTPAATTTPTTTTTTSPSTTRDRTTSRGTTTSTISSPPTTRDRTTSRGTTTTDRITTRSTTNPRTTATTTTTTTSAPNERYELMVQLVGGDSSSGSVEVRRDGSDWGPVCSGTIGVREASVICGQLGFRWGRATANTYDPSSAAPAWLDQVRCAGGEANIGLCSHGSWGQSSCAANESVAVECLNTTVAFTNGTDTYYGHVYMVRDLQLVPICNNGWNDPDALVACQEMGFRWGRAYPNLILNNGWIYPPREAAVWYFGCRGTEESLGSCSYRTVQYGCGAGIFATAVCFSTPPEDNDYLSVSAEIVNDNGTKWGRVEVEYNGVRSTVCNRYVDDREATLICRQHGVMAGSVMGNAGFPVDEQMPILLTSPGCIGNETQLAQCTSFNMTTVSIQTTCTHSSDMYVLCHEQPIQWRLGGAVSSQLGRVELQYEGVWGSVCANGATEEDAVTACVSLGFIGGAIYRGASLQAATGPVWLSSVRCLGNEQDLLECATSGWQLPPANSSCANHGNDLVVACHSQVRIVGGASPDFGRVETRSSSGYWRLVCGSGWDDADAAVVCRQLGWANGKALCCAAFGSISTSYGADLTRVRCQGNETSLLDCPASGYYCSSYRSNYASVYCYSGELNETDSHVYLDAVDAGADYAGRIGRVRVVYQGLDGRICNTNWGAEDANVTCKELGFAGGVAYNIPGQGVGPVVLEDVNCEGNETRLQDCDHNPWRADTCEADAGVLCYNDTGIRLRIEGGGTSGNVIVEYDGTVGHVCDSDWTTTDARQACEDMGYVGGSISPVVQSDTPLPVLMQEVRCGGRELSFYQCLNSGWNYRSNDTCNDQQRVASVLCYNRVRLDLISSGLGFEIGRVNLYDSSYWTSICGIGFNDTHARIVCTELGYSYSKAPNPYFFPSTSSYYMISNVVCGGNETSLSDCNYSPRSYYYFSDCTNRNRNAAVVICSEQPLEEAYSFSWVDEGTASYTGQVRVTSYGVQGKVCPSAWSDQAANVFCKQHGYLGGVALSYRVYSTRTNWVLSLNCTGDEVSLTDCHINTNITGPCGSSREVGALCYSTQGVGYRLKDGERPLEGRVEIQYDGTWGAVCDEGWSSSDAEVVCRQLGYYGGDAITGSQYGDGPAVQWISQVDCTGDEETLLQCPTGGWHALSDPSGCGPGHSAGVRCYENVRTLTGGSAGPLQAHMNGYWGYICDDGWDDNDALVACRTLGYTSGTGACCSIFGSNSYVRKIDVCAITEIWLKSADDVIRQECQPNGYAFTDCPRQSGRAGGGTGFALGGFDCDGTETDLLDCPHRSGSYISCQNRNYASVICFEEEPSNNISDVQIMERSNSAPIDLNAGIIQVYFVDTWGYVCPDNWTNTEATVLCRQLGYPGQGIAYASTLSVYGTVPFWLCNVSCNGTEDNLSQCTNNGWGKVEGCSTRDMAAVMCLESAPVTRLVQGGTNYGRVEVSVNGVWGTVCDQGWDDEDAEVACRSLGYRSGTATTGSSYGAGSGSFWLSGLTCSGNEQSLLECAHPGLATTSSSYWSWRCSSHAYDAGAHCFGSVRVVDGPSLRFGRAEAYLELDRSWHVFCDDGTFTDAHAQVLCRAQGYPGGRAICCSAVQPIESNHYQGSLMNVSCLENGTGIADCNYTVAQCPSQSYVSIYCFNQPNNLTSSQLRVSVNETENGYSIPVYNGRVIVNAHGIEGRVCMRDWDDRAANVTCKMLGYAGGVAYQFSMRRLAPYILSHVNCTGLENDLNSCTYLGYQNDSGCSYTNVDAGVLCYYSTGIQTRLSSQDHGLVEISRDGDWGLVCTTGWSSNDARVLCRQLGYVDGTTTSETPPYSGNMEVWMSSIYCTGTEASLLQCKNAGWGNVPYYCSRSYRFAGARCYNSVRLTTNTQSLPVTAGSVEVFVNGEWGLVCDVGFDNNDARVVCRQLGFVDGIQSCCGAFGFRYMPTVWTNLGCNGNETDIHNCTHASMPINNDCNYASAVCLSYNRTSTEDLDYTLQISMVGGLSYSGKLLVEVHNVTGRICSDGWTDQDAKVACHELGYQNGEAYHHYDAYTNYLDEIGPWWTSNVECATGNESRLQQCDFADWGNVFSCQSGHSAGVLCYSSSGTFFRMAGGGDNYGRVEVAVDGEWGTVCDTNWAWPEAAVFCRQMGFADGEPLSSTMYERGTGPVWMSRLQCVGDEDSLVECGHSGFNAETSTSCRYHLRDAGVYCYKAVRLDNGISSSQGNASAGALLYVHEHTWTTVCADNFTDLTAREVCEELGFYDGRAILYSAYRFQPYDILNGTLVCHGSETDIRECYKETGPCDSGFYASVFCLSRNHSYDDTEYAFTLDAMDGGEVNDHGPVRVHYLGYEGRVCSVGWDDEEAMVLCHSLGYGHGIAYNQTTGNLASTRSGFTTTSDGDHLPFLLSGFNCTGWEDTLLECPHNDRLALGNCSWDTMAGALCFSNYSDIEYRLADGPTPNQGRVEMAIDGVWGTICDSSWDNADARVLCRDQGYSDGQAFGEAHYGEGSGTVWVSHIHCTGEEESLHQCPHQGFNTSFTESAILTWDSDDGGFITPSWPVFKYCWEHENDASVFCFGRVRLSGGANVSSGAVQVYEDGNWTLVCDDGWTDGAARVVCRQLGFQDGRGIPNSSFGVMEDQVISSQYACVGTETALSECRSSRGCTSAMYASVYCSNSTLNETANELRIQNDTLSSERHGVVEVQLGGLWGRVCYNGWGDQEASVACRMLGFKGGVPYRHIYSGESPIMMSNVTCHGDEESLFECAYSRWGDPHVCRTTQLEAGVLCYNDTGVSYDITGGTNSSGRVQVIYDGVMGTVCDLYWNMPDAHVFCKSLGFKDGQAVSGDTFGRGTGPIWLQAAMCQGDESSLLECPHSGWNISWSIYSFYTCDSHSRDAGVKCYQDIMAISDLRLADGPSESAGRVEVYVTQAEEWGTVCDDDFDDLDAQVICRQLGYNHGEAVTSTNMYFGSGSGPIWLDNLECYGNESAVQDCPHLGIGNHNCHHFEDAGVECSDPFVTLPASTSTTTVSSTTTSMTTSRPVNISSTATTASTTPITTSTTTATTTTATSTTASTTSSTTATTTTSTQSIHSSSTTWSTRPPLVSTTHNGSLPEGRASSGGLSTTLTALVSVLAIVATVALLLILLFVMFRYRSKYKRHTNGGPINMCDIDQSVPYDAASMDPDADRQFSNKLYDLVGKGGDLYKEFDPSVATDEDGINGNTIMTTDHARLTSHEFLPAMEEVSFTNAPPGNEERRDSTA